MTHGPSALVALVAVTYSPLVPLLPLLSLPPSSFFFFFFFSFSPFVRIAVSIGAVYVDMFKLYRPAVRSWFESAYYFRKTLLAALTVFIAAEPIWRQIFLFIAAMLMLFVHLVFRPYNSRRDNVLGSFLMGSLAITAGLEVYSVAAFYVTFDEGAADPATARFVSISHILMMAWPVLYLVYFNAAHIRTVIKGFCSRRKARKAEAFEAHQARMAKVHTHFPYNKRRSDSGENKEGVEMTVFNPIMSGASEPSDPTPRPSPRRPTFATRTNITERELGKGESALRHEVRYLQNMIGDAVSNPAHRKTHK